MKRCLFQKTAAMLLAGCFCFLCFTSCRQKDDYQSGRYDQDELLTVFESQRSLFYDVAKILIENDRFWDKGRRYEDDAHVRIMSPNEADKMGLFTQDQQETLSDFFDQTHPYQVSLNAKGMNEETVSFLYINADQTDAFAIEYYFGDKAALNFYGRNAYQDWIAAYKDSYNTFIELGNDWYLYYDSKALDALPKTEEGQ